VGEGQKVKWSDAKRVMILKAWTVHTSLVEQVSCESGLGLLLPDSDAMMGLGRSECWYGEVSWGR
jgi:hypothetical protein